jgi:RNase adaptor protein for sRNA GlmZ degradation
MPRVDHSKAEVGIYTFAAESPNRVATCQYLINVVGLRDPSSSGMIRSVHKDGRPGEVQDYIQEDPRVKAVVDQIRLLTYMHLKSEGRDGKWLSFGIHDHHGKWIAPAIGEIAARTLDTAGYHVSLFHADLEGK